MKQIYINKINSGDKENPQNESGISKKGLHFKYEGVEKGQNVSLISE